MKVNGFRIIPYIMENKKCLKPPTSKRIARGQPGFDAEMDGPLNPGGGNRFGSVITSSNPGRCLTMSPGIHHINMLTIDKPEIHHR